MPSYLPMDAGRGGGHTYRVAEIRAFRLRARRPVFHTTDRSDQSAQRTSAPLPSSTSGESPVTSVRSAVRELHDESERRAPRRWSSLWSRSEQKRATISRLGLADDEELPSNRIVGLLAQLRVATRLYVVGLRSDGVPPEQMLVQVKALVCGAMMDEGWWDRDATRSLVSAMVVWSIDAYYSL